MSDQVKVYSSLDIWKNVEENAHDSKPLISKRFYTESDFDRVSKELESDNQALKEDRVEEYKKAIEWELTANDRYDKIQDLEQKIAAQEQEIEILRRQRNELHRQAGEYLDLDDLALYDADIKRTPHLSLREAD